MSRHDTCITHKYQTPVQMTHCVSANDARALTQIDTNTAGTPNVIKKKNNYCENSVLVITITVTGVMMVPQPMMIRAHR